MRILFVNHSMLSGGAERALSNIANGLNKLGFEIYITVFDEGRSDYELNKSVKLVSYPLKTKGKVFTFLWRIMLARKAFKDISPDIIISFSARTNIYSIIANFFLNYPILISERNDPNSDPSQWYYRLLRKLLYRFSNGFIFQTNEAKKYFTKKIQEKSIVIPNPVILNYTQSKKDMIVRDKTIVSIGRLSKQKNHKLLIDAYSDLNSEFKDYKLIIYGEGNLRSELEKYITEKGLADKVSLPGRFSDIHDRISNSSLFVLSSDYEGMSNALMEAMALGLPSISTDCPIGGSSDLIQTFENGILTPVGDINKLTQAMEELLGNSDLANKIGEKAKGIKKTNSIDTIIKMWEAYIIKIHKAYNKTP